MMEQVIWLNEKKSKIKVKGKVKGTGNEYATEPANQAAQNLGTLNQRLSIEIDNIMEKEIDRLSTDKVLRKRYAKDIILLRKQWKNFCTTYRKIVRENDNFERNRIATKYKKQFHDKMATK